VPCVITLASVIMQALTERQSLISVLHRKGGEARLRGALERLQREMNLIDFLIHPVWNLPFNTSEVNVLRLLVWQVVQRTEGKARLRPPPPSSDQGRTVGGLGFRLVVT
jgi:hypothetical protein